MSPSHTTAGRRRYISLQDGAEYAGVAVKTVRRWIARGDLTGYRAGPRLIRVDLDEIDSMLHPIPTAGGNNAA